MNANLLASCVTTMELQRRVLCNNLVTTVQMLCSLQASSYLVEPSSAIGSHMSLPSFTPLPFAPVTYAHRLEPMGLGDSSDYVDSTISPSARPHVPSYQPGCLYCRPELAHCPSSFWFSSEHDIKEKNATRQSGISQRLGRRDRESAHATRSRSHLLHVGSFSCI